MNLALNYEPTGGEEEAFIDRLASLLLEQARCVAAKDRRRSVHLPTRGPLPLGYRAVYLEGRRFAVLDGSTAPLVREAFRLAAEGLSLRESARRTAAEGLVAREGGPFGPSSMGELLRGRFYIRPLA